MSTQAQIEQNLKEKIVKLDRELEEAKKEARLRQSAIDDVKQKYEESEREREQLKFNLEKSEHDKNKLTDAAKKN